MQLGFQMDIFYIDTDIVNFVFSLLLFSWLIIGCLRRRREQSSRELNDFKKLTILLLGVLLSILYAGFGFYEYWVTTILSFKSISLFITWILATVVSFDCAGTSWPVVLVSWWVFSFASTAISVLFLLVTYLRSSTELPKPVSKASDFVDFVTFALSMLMCFHVLKIYSTKSQDDHLEHPLLEKELECDNVDTFTTAGIWGKITFTWLNPLFVSGRTQKLDMNHVPLVPLSETAEHASLILEESLRQPKIDASSMSKSITHAIWKSLAVNAVFAGVNTIASYAGPVLITKFVKFLSTKHEDTSYHFGLVLAFTFLFFKTVESLAQRQWYFGAQRIGVRVRAALMVLLYKKSLSTKFASLNNGKITNLINMDVERIGELFSHIHGVWLLPLQVSLALVILCWNLGALPSLAALVSTILVMVSNTPLAKTQKKFHLKIMESKDSRVKATCETLKSMKVLKLHSWEPTFLKNILQLRDTERNWLRKYLYTCSAVAVLFWASPTLVSVITFGVCIVLKTPLTPSTVLSALATFRILQEPIYNLPELISVIAQTKVSVDRIEEFIKEEGQKWLTSHQNSTSPDIVVVEIEKGEYSWDTSNLTLTKPTIKIAEKIKISQGDKIAICGSVGSGKSSLLCSILGEIPRISGTGITVKGRKAYVTQSPWIQTGTIRENILFGKDMDMSFYEYTVDACALNQDCQLWDEGDLSLVGERGLNLSGGQKQRLQLARAVYSDSDVYILDDPFSAVDAHTATHLFKKCLLQLLSKKTVIYATHNLEFLDAADLVLVMKDGMIVQSGKYLELIEDSNGELVRHMAAHTKALTQVNKVHEGVRLTTWPCKLNQIEVMEENTNEAVNKCNTCRSFEKSQEEEIETGRVKWSVYSSFVSCAYKGALVPVIILCQILFQGFQMGSTYWIAWATEDGRMRSREKLIGIFALFSGVSSIFILGRAVFLATIAVETSQRMFLGMIKSIFQAPISFFDKTPSSRILYTSSMDQSIVDTDIPYRLAGLVFALIQLLSVIFLMSHVSWYIFILFLAILGISGWYQSYYISTARELARMVAIKKAPILHHFSESIAGATTVRSFNQEDQFLAKTLNLINDHSRVVFHNAATMEWLCVRINFLFNLGFFIVLVILVSLPRSVINPSLAGLTATYGLNLNVLQAWIIWNLCNVENKMISVERILQFTNIPSGAPLIIEDCRPKLEWPLEGKIEFRDLHVQYSPSLPSVLKGITCTLPGEKKIGVVGRTGSGKSTLIQALFRVVEPSQGMILIDKLDISKIGLQDLRSRLGIIPQDATLFQGNLRHNLDPLKQHSDQEIWEVLNKCHLVEMVKQDERLLDAPVAEDGENWSIGQRQLICLARMLFQRKKILVLDEATASVDTATDNVIQGAIREETSWCTVITVAHRIATVIDNDLVMVLDQGRVVEFDSPSKLLEDSCSSFSKLVAELLKPESISHSHR